MDLLYSCYSRGKLEYLIPLDHDSLQPVLTEELNISNFRMWYPRPISNISLCKSVACLLHLTNSAVSINDNFFGDSVLHNNLPQKLAFTQLCISIHGRRYKVDIVCLRESLFRIVAFEKWTSNRMSYFVL